MLIKYTKYFELISRNLSFPVIHKLAKLAFYVTSNENKLEEFINKINLLQMDIFHDALN